MLDGLRPTDRPDKVRERAGEQLPGRSAVGSPGKGRPPLSSVGPALSRSTFEGVGVRCSDGRSPLRAISGHSFNSQRMASSRPLPTSRSHTRQHGHVLSGGATPSLSAVESGTQVGHGGPPRLSRPVERPDRGDTTTGSLGHSSCPDRQDLGFSPPVPLERAGSGAKVTSSSG